MNTEELRSKSIDELKQDLLDLQKEQFNLRMQKNVSDAPRNHLFKQVRRNIARVKTILQEKGRES